MGPAANIPDFGASLTQGINSGISLSKAGSEIGVMQEQIKLLGAQYNLTEEQTVKVSTEVENIMQLIEQSKSLVKLQDAQRGVAETQKAINEVTESIQRIVLDQEGVNLDQLKVALEIARMEEEAMRNMPGDRQLEYLGRSSGGIATLLGSVLGLFGGYRLLKGAGTATREIYKKGKGTNIYKKNVPDLYERIKGVVTEFFKRGK